MRFAIIAGIVVVAIIAVGVGLTSFGSRKEEWTIQKLTFLQTDENPRDILVNGENVYVLLDLLSLG